MIYATYLEDNERRKLELFQAISARCDELQRAQPKNVNGHYFQAYALGRYSQGISVLKALTDGLGGRIKSALEASFTARSEARRGAHVALGAYHAEVVDKMGAMVAKLTYRREQGSRHQALRYGIEAGPGFGDRPHRVCQCAGPAVRRQAHG
jgi:hypothetical protein